MAQKEKKVSSPVAMEKRQSEQPMQKDDLEHSAM